MNPNQRWLTAMGRHLDRYLPGPPAAVVDLGCGPLGGFVPMLRARGYDAVGIDPQAPDGPEYIQAAFEEVRLPQRPQAVVASTSLHHVHDPGRVVNEIAAQLTPRGLMIVIEWDWEHFDEPTARWCFERLDPAAEEGWLRRHRDRWLASGQPWDDQFRSWVEEERLHPPRTLIRALDHRFDRRFFGTGPYYFPHLGNMSEADEGAAIEEGTIRPGRIDYVGEVRASVARRGG